LNTTQNYQLSQWEESDRVLRSTFNENNAKIDAALKAATDAATDAAAAAPYRKLKSITTAATVQQVDIDMSDINPTDYLRFEIYVAFSSASTGSYASLLCNGLTSGYKRGDGTANTLVYTMADIDKSGYRGATCFEVYIGSAITGCSRSMSEQYNSGATYLFNLLDPAVCAPSALNAFNITTNSVNVVGAGTKIEIYGVKK
jgi:hypothetical protein